MTNNWRIGFWVILRNGYPKQLLADSRLPFGDMLIICQYSVSDKIAGDVSVENLACTGVCNV